MGHNSTKLDLSKVDFNLCKNIKLNTLQKQQVLSDSLWEKGPALIMVVRRPG